MLESDVYICTDLLRQCTLAVRPAPFLISLRPKRLQIRPYLIGLDLKSPVAPDQALLLIALSSKSRYSPDGANAAPETAIVYFRVTISNCS